MLPETEVDLQIVSKDYRPEDPACFAFSLELSLISLKTRPEIQQLIAPKAKKTDPKNDGTIC